MKHVRPTVYLASQSPRRQELLAQLEWCFELLLPRTLSDLSGLGITQSEVGFAQANAHERSSKRVKGDDPQSTSLASNVSLNSATFAAQANEQAQQNQDHKATLSKALEDLERAHSGEEALAYVKRVTHLKFELAKNLARAMGRGYDPSRPLMCADTTVVLDRTILGKPQTPSEAREMLLALSARTHRVYTCVVVGNLSHQAHRVSRSWVRFAPLSESQVDEYLHTQEWMGKAGGYAVQGRAAAFIEQIRGSYSGIMGLPLFETAQLLEDFVQRGLNVT